MKTNFRQLASTVITAGRLASSGAWGSGILPLSPGMPTQYRKEIFTLERLADSVRGQMEMARFTLPPGWKGWGQTFITHEYPDKNTYVMNHISGGDPILQVTRLGSADKRSAVALGSGSASGFHQLSGRKTASA
ncbi:MAG: hypothetical protein HQL73_10895 [Magnetococcales bacterium]|nr:hypothetical protein [Magnetococcales bacterium]